MHRDGEAKLPIKYDKLATARARLQAGSAEIAARAKVASPMHKKADER